MLCLAALLGGCASGYRKVGWINSGYDEKPHGFNGYVVRYHGGDLVFCKKGALYRAAELCKQQGFRYFKVKSEQVISSFAQNIKPIDLGSERWREEDPTASTPGLVRTADVAGYSYTVEFEKKDPMDGSTYEAEEVLKSRP